MTAPLSDGALLWVFCATQVLPAAAIVRDSTAAIAAPDALASPSDVLDGTDMPYEFITPSSTWDQVCDPGVADGRRVRPLSADTVTSGATDRVLVFYEHVCVSGGDTVGSGGIGVAEFLYDAANPPTGPIQATVVTDVLWNGTAPAAPPGSGSSDEVTMGGFGSVSAYDPAGDRVYVYRCDTATTPVQGCQAGRVAPTQVGNPSAYSWWDADHLKWSATVPDPGMATMSMGTRGSESPIGVGRVDDVTWHATMGVWAMTFLEWGQGVGHGATAVVYVANHPTGPWSSPVRVTLPGCEPTAPQCRGIFDHPALSGSTAEVTLGYFEDPAVGGDGAIRTVDAGMFADSWVDVPRSDPDFGDLDLLGTDGVVDRVHPDYLFRPDDPTTRGDGAEILWRVVGRPASSPESPTFSDVSGQHPNADAVEWLAATSTDDTPPGVPWLPDGALARQTFALWLWNDAGAPSVNAAAVFSDVPASHPYFAPIMWAYEHGLIAGTSASTFEPQGSVTRRDAGVASMTFRDQMLRGTVTDASTGQPVADAKVTVYDATDAMVRTVTTGSLGRYHVSWLPASADYSVGFAALEFVDEWYDDKPQAGTDIAGADPVAIKVETSTRSATTADADLAPVDVVLTRPSPDAKVFATEHLEATVSGFDNLDRVEFSIDGSVVASDLDPIGGWTADWDTTSVADGSHTVQATAVDTAGGRAASLSHEVAVANDLPPWERVQTDYDRNNIDVNAYLPLLLKSNLESPGLLPARYAGPTAGNEVGATTELLKALTGSWEALDQPTEDQLEALLTPSVQAGPADPGFVAEFGLFADPGDEAVYPGCNNNVIEWGHMLAVRGVWCVETIPYTAAVCQGASFTCSGNGVEVPDLKFRYSVNGSEASFVDDPTSEIPGKVVPQQMLDMANQFFNAFESYGNMGFELGGNLDDGKPLNVVMNTISARAFTVPICWSCHGPTPFSDFGVVIGPPEPSDPGDILSTVRHESFHIMQYNYVSEYDVLGEFLPGSAGRDTTLWWLEATAEWADHQAVAAMQADGQSPPGPTNYASSFDDLVDDPGRKLTRFLTDENPQYGAFILAEYFQDRFDTPGFPSFVLRTFQELDEQDDSVLGLNERTAIEVIEDVLDENGTTLKNVIPRFWVSAYLLDQANMIGVGFDDPDADDWRSALDSTETIPDNFSEMKRLGRANDGTTHNSPAAVPHLGATGPLSFKVGHGGVGVIDFSTEPGWTGTVQASIGIGPPANDDHYVAVMVAYDDSGYPNVCDRNGYTVIEFQDLASASGTHVDLDEECPTASLFVVNHDANSDSADYDAVDVILSMDEPVPMAPPTTQTATIDGPGATGIGPGGLLGIVSDPPSAGPTSSSGALCVAVDVHAGNGGGWLFPQVGSIIQLVDPFTGTVLSQLSGLDTLMSANTTRTFNLGPYVHDPWTALAVTVKEDLGDVLSWDAYPTSC